MLNIHIFGIIFTLYKKLKVMSKKPAQTVIPLLVLVCLGHFAVDFSLGIWPVYKTMAGLDFAIAGMIAASSVVLAEGLQAYFGGLSDKGYQRELLLLGIALSTLATCFSYAHSAFFFLFLFLGTCLGSSAFHPTAASILSGFEGKNASTIMGIFTAAGMMGLGVSQMIFAWTYATFDGHTSVLAIPSLVLAITVFFYFKGKTAPSKEATSGHHSFALYFRFMKVKGLRALYFSMLGNQIVLWSLVFLLPDFLKERGFASWIVLGGGHLCLMVGATIGPPLFGYLADKISTRQVIILGSILTPVLFYMLLLPVQLTEGLLFSLLFSLGAILGSVPPLIWAWGGRLVPQHRGVISAFLMGFVWIVSEGLGLGLSGYLASLFTENPAATALACMGSMQLLCSFANLQIPRSSEEQMYHEIIV